MEQKKERIQINIVLSKELRSQIRLLAFQHNISICEWLRRAAIERIYKETRYNKEEDGK
jgi:hypothetical protein